MKRKCIILRPSSYYRSRFNRAVCIDIQNEADIYEILSDKKRKFWQIIERLLTQPNIYYDHYKKEKIDERSKHVAAIRFLDTHNTRIYCKEVSTIEGVLYIICCIGINKKVQKNDKKIDEIIKSISKYEYEIIEQD